MPTPLRTGQAVQKITITPILERLRSGDVRRSDTLFENVTGQVDALYLSRRGDAIPNSLSHKEILCNRGEEKGQRPLGTRFATPSFDPSLARPIEERLMLKELESVLPRLRPISERGVRLRSTRPSLLDLRFTGDPWVVAHEDGTASVRLDNYRLAGIRTVPFDVPSLNQLLLQLRQSQLRRQLYRQLQARRRAI
jgi:hypothetical protein